MELSVTPSFHRTHLQAKLENINKQNINYPLDQNIKKPIRSKHQKALIINTYVVNK